MPWRTKKGEIHLDQSNEKFLALQLILPIYLSFKNSVFPIVSPSNLNIHFLTQLQHRFKSIIKKGEGIIAGWGMWNQRKSHKDQHWKDCKAEATLAHFHQLLCLDSFQQWVWAKDNLSRLLCSRPNSSQTSKEVLFRSTRQQLCAPCTCLTKLVIRNDTLLQNSKLG